jgi:hypothetical protein
MSRQKSTTKARYRIAPRSDLSIRPGSKGFPLLDRSGRILEMVLSFGSESGRDEASDRQRYAEHLAELEDAARRSRKHGPRGPFLDEPPELDTRAPILYARDWLPTAEYAKQFLAQTLDYLQGPRNPDEEALGRRGKMVIERLLFMPGAPGTGRRFSENDPEVWRQDVKNLRPKILQESQKMMKECKPRADHDATAEDYQEYRNRLVRLILKYLPKLPLQEANQRATRLSRRKRLRPAELANQIVGWLLGLRPADVQRLASGQ